MSWITKRVSRLVHKSISSSRLIADGETVVVGISGGADSLCLLHLLESLNRTGRRNWDLHAVHVDPGYGGWNPARIVRVCKTVGIDCTVLHGDGQGSTKRAGHDSCYVCARKRRQALFSFCGEAGSSRSPTTWTT